MELLLSAVITLLTQVFKWFVEKIGIVKAKAYTLVFVLVLSIIGTFAWKQYEGSITWGDAKSLISVIGLAIGYYELIIKKVVNPIIENFKTLR